MFGLGGVMAYPKLGVISAYPKSVRSVKIEFVQKNIELL
jgi:hypothetical protein